MNDVLSRGRRLLDLAGGQGEMLCRFALHDDDTAVGVDIYSPFVATARARAADLGVEGVLARRDRS